MAATAQQIEAIAQRRIEAHRNPRGPFEYPLNDGRTIQVVERKTHDNSTVVAYTDITEYRRRQDALTLIVGNRPEGRSFLDAAAKALAVGLGYRWAGIAELGRGRSARRAFWRSGPMDSRSHRSPSRWPARPAAIAMRWRQDPGRPRPRTGAVPAGQMAGPVGGGRLSGRRLLRRDMARPSAMSSPSTTSPICVGPSRIRS